MGFWTTILDAIKKRKPDGYFGSHYGVHMCWLIKGRTITEKEEIRLRRAIGVIVSTAREIDGLGLGVKIPLFRVAMVDGDRYHRNACGYIVENAKFGSDQEVVVLTITDEVAPIKLISAWVAALHRHNMGYASSQLAEPSLCWRLRNTMRCRYSRTNGQDLDPRVIVGLTKQWSKNGRD